MSKDWFCWCLDSNLQWISHSKECHVRCHLHCCGICTSYTSHYCWKNSCPRIFFIHTFKTFESCYQLFGELIWQLHFICMVIPYASVINSRQTPDRNLAFRILNWRVKHVVIHLEPWERWKTNNFTKMCLALARVPDGNNAGTIRKCHSGTNKWLQQTRTPCSLFSCQEKHRPGHNLSTIQ